MLKNSGADYFDLDDCMRGKYEPEVYNEVMEMVREGGAGNGEEVSALMREINWHLVIGEIEVATGVELIGRLDAMLHDLHALPMAEGDARPSDERLEEIEDMGANLDVFNDLADGLFDSIAEHSEKRSAADYFNSFLTFDEERAKLIWDTLMQNAGVKCELEYIAGVLAKGMKAEEGQSPEQLKALAMEDLRAYLVNHPTKYLSAKNPALILMNKLKDFIVCGFEERVVEEVKKGLPLVEGTEALEDPDEFAAAVFLAQDFKAMNERAYLDMLANPLGQAQTADPDKGEAFFRSREGVEGLEIQNNFGYVYLSKEQFDAMPGLKGSGKGAEFKYFGKPYYAVPVGTYFLNRDENTKETFTTAMSQLEQLADKHRGTPVADYYNLLIKYYDLPLTADNVADPAFVKEYHDVCYAAERAWVAYVAYAGKHELAFIHIHPFEKYETTSTKSHDLSVGILNHKETKTLAEAKEAYLAHVKKFLERSGIAGKYPEMAAESIRLMESAPLVSLAARMATQMHGTIAQNIPNEEPGRQDGVAVLCDIAFAQKSLKSNYGAQAKMSDPVGGIAEAYEAAISDWDTFILHYIIEVISHELHHNMFKGSKQVFGGDGRGLAIQLIEEAKATNGLAFYCEDPDNMTQEEIEKFRKALPAMIAWSTARFQKRLRAQHSSHQYLREGAVMLDHMLKCGLLEVNHVEIGEDGEPIVGECIEGEGGFEFLRYNLGDEQIKGYIARCARFVEKLAPVYHKTEGFEGTMDPKEVVPDDTSIDTWQAASRECRLEERAKLVAQHGEGHPDVMAIDLALEKLVPPGDETIALQVKALICNASYLQPGRMRAEVARAFGLALDAPELDAKVCELQAKLKISHPQVYGTEVGIEV